MIKVTCTYETWTPEDCEHGETDDRGILWSDTFSFRELVWKLKAEFEESSCLGMGVDAHTYFLYRNPDYRTGGETSVAMHFDRDNDPRLVKYWAKAARAARLVG
jgi:hypothetical protein